MSRDEKKVRRHGISEERARQFVKKGIRTEWFVLPAAWRDFLCGVGDSVGLWKPEYERVSRFLKALEKETKREWRCITVSRPFLAEENDFEDDMGFVCRYEFMSLEEDFNEYEVE